MAATSMAVEMLKLLLLLLLLLLLEDAKSSWDIESRDASFSGASVFILVHRHVGSRVAVQPFPLPLLLPLAFLFSRSRALQRPSETRRHNPSRCWLCGSKPLCVATSSASQLRYRERSLLRNGPRRRCGRMHHLCRHQLIQTCPAPERKSRLSA